MANLPQRPATYAATNPNNVSTQSVVNVTPFGFTSNDNTSVKDILTYVKTASTAADKALEAVADIDTKLGEVQDLAGKVQDNKDATDTAMANVTAIAKQVSDGQIDIQAEVSKANTFATAAAQNAADANKANNEVKANALASVYRFYEGNNVVGNTLNIRAINGSVQHFILQAPTTTITLEESPGDTDNTARQFTLIFQQGTGANNIDWPQTVDSNNRPTIAWNNSREPILSYVKGMEDVVTILTTDKGKHWYGFFNGGWFNIAP